MEYFIYGIVLGYFLFPLTQIAGKIIANAWVRTIEDLRTAKRCGGNCNQGRSACECEEK